MDQPQIPLIARYAASLMPQGIQLIDIGSSGSLDAKWTPIRTLIHLTGFDPNGEECARQNAMPSAYASSRFLPYAVHGESGRATLYRTRSIYCYSLLPPDKAWLDRFSFRELFDVLGTEELEVQGIDRIRELDAVHPDVIKIDVQGLELPILGKAGRLLDEAFYVETETGFTPNYRGETTFAQLDQFMRDQGFLMFDINPNHRIPRDNAFRDRANGREQILWAEAVWLKDYVGLARQGRLAATALDAGKARRALVLCALQGCRDYGLELADLFVGLGLLPAAERDLLRETAHWSFDTLPLPPAVAAASTDAVAPVPAAQPAPAAAAAPAATVLPAAAPPAPAVPRSERLARLLRHLPLRVRRGLLEAARRSVEGS